MLSPQRRRARRAASGLGPVAAAALAAFPAAAAALVAAGFAAAPTAAHAQSAGRAPRYTNLVNDRFATVSNGPQSVLIVDVPRNASPSDIRTAVEKRVRADIRSRSRSMSPVVAKLRKAGVLKNGAAIPVSNVVVLRQGGDLILPTRKAGAATRAVGGGRLTFRYTGFNDFNARLLDVFVQEVTGVINDVYGLPAVSAEVEVRNIGAADEPGGTTDVNALRFGYYLPSGEGGRPQILLPDYPESGEQSLLPAMLLNMLHAYHGPAVFQYDAWEQGFARAAASVILRRFQTRLGVDDPTANSTFSLLPYYDLLNQPGLGSPTFFPRAQANVDLTGDVATGGFTLGKMIFPRMGMSGAAWLKVYVENPNFFRQFNEAYYARFTPGETPSLAGNVPELKAIAANLVPNVEGEPFDPWYRKQYVLDTSISPGRKLYALIIPDNIPDDTDGISHLIVLNYFQTVFRDGAADEDLLAGPRAYATYFDSDNSQLTFGLPADEAPIAQGEAFFTVTAQQRQGTDATRLTADFSVGNDVARVYFPTGYGGDFIGAILGPGAGGTARVEQASVLGQDSRTQQGAVEGASFGVNLGTPFRDLARTTITVTNGSQVSTFRRNTGDGAAWVVLRPDSNGGQVVTRSRAFSAGPVPNLVTFPVRPLTTDIPQALGNLSVENFLLTYWDPLRGAGGGYETAVSDPGASISAIQPGRGYWLKLYSPTNQAQVNVSMEGVPPPTDTDVTISAPLGWNLIGSPFEGTISLDRILVKYLQNAPITWDEAVERGYVAPEPFGWQRDALQYQPATAGLDGTNWQGYWLRVYVPNGVTLLLPGPDSPVTRSVGRRGGGRSGGTKVNKPDWSVRLRARIQTEDDVVVGKTAAAEFGATRGATRGFDNRYDREAPPPIVPAMSVTFPHSDFGKASGGRYVADFREPSLRGSYTVQVTAPRPGRVTLTWDNLNSVPRHTGLTLVDKETGERIPMRSRSSFTFNVQGDRLTRLFEVETDRGRTTPLMVSNIRTQSVPGRAADGRAGRMTISYDVSAQSEVMVEVTSLTGRVLTRLGSGRAEAPGTRSVSWDGRTAEGTNLPPGPYMVRVTARADDGTQVVQLRPMVKVR